MALIGEGACKGVSGEGPRYRRESCFLDNPQRGPQQPLRRLFGTHHEGEGGAPRRLVKGAFLWAVRSGDWLVGVEGAYRRGCGGWLLRTRESSWLDRSLSARPARRPWPPLCVPCRRSPPRAARRPQLQWARTRATSCSRSWPLRTRAWMRLRRGAAPGLRGNGRGRDEDRDRCGRAWSDGQAEQPWARGNEGCRSLSWTRGWLCGERGHQSYRGEDPALETRDVGKISALIICYWRERGPQVCKPYS